MNIKEKIPEPTKDDLKLVYDEMGTLDSLVMYGLLCIDSNFYVLLAGVIVGIPVTLLINIIGYSLDGTIENNLFFCGYIIIFLFSLLLCINYVACTIRHIELRDKVKNQQEKEIYINKLFQLGNINMKYIKKKVIKIFIIVILMFVFCFFCFYINNQVV